MAERPLNRFSARAGLTAWTLSSGPDVRLGWNRLPLRGSAWDSGPGERGGVMPLESADSVTRPPALDAPTVAAAFQATAAAYGGASALRTKDDAISLTWGEYAERVRAVAAGLAALGVERGDTVGIMLTNRPEFHFADSAAMHLGATP